MGKNINKEDTIIKDDGVRIIFKNDIVYKVIYTKGKPPPLTNFQRKKENKRTQKYIKLFCKSWYEGEGDY